MDRRQIIRHVLSGGRNERLPRALFGGGRWAYRQAGLKIRDIGVNPKAYADALARVLRELDTDIVFAGSGLNSFPAEAIGGELAFRDEQAPLLSTPLIHKTGDAQYLEEVDISHSLHTLALIEMFAVLRERLSERFLCVTSWGPFTWAMILCDWNFLREKTATDRAFIQEVCQLGVRLSLSLFNRLIERGLVDGIVISDGAVTLIPDDLYQEVVLPCEKEIFDQVRHRGVSCFLHQCGNIKNQLPLYPETGADCISIDTGVDIGEVYDLYHRKLVTAGNVDVINTVCGGDLSVLCKAVGDCVGKISDPLNRYILMPSCDLPPETPLGNVKEFLACADRIGL